MYQALTRTRASTLVARLNRPFCLSAGSCGAPSRRARLNVIPPSHAIPQQRRNLASVSDSPAPPPTLPNKNASNGDVTPIEQLVLDTIKLTGPISFARYMSLCLSHPTHGYYMNPSNAVFGTQGDFITSPEISQVFGELLGIWLLSQYVPLVTPSSPAPPVRMIELGPGRGTLMDDVLRVLRKFLPPGTLQSVHLVETSKALREVQGAKLGATVRRPPPEGTTTTEDDVAYSTDGKLRVQWHDSIAEIERRDDVYTMLVAHEFFDALPVHVVHKTEAGWNEVLIAASESRAKVEEVEGSKEAVDEPPASSSSSSPKRLHRVLAPLPSPTSTLLGNSSPRFRTLPVGATVEVSPLSFKIAHMVGRLVGGWDVDQMLKNGQATAEATRASASHVGGEDLKDPLRDDAAQGLGGAALFIDYGSSSPHSDSLRAFKGHKMVDVFTDAGQCDLTADVDFGYLREGIGGLAKTLGPLTQHTFLTRMGIHERVGALLSSAGTEERRKAIKDAAERLVDASGMGGQYKVMGLVGGRGGGDLSSKSQASGEVVWPFVEEVGREKDGPGRQA